MSKDCYRFNYTLAEFFIKLSLNGVETRIIEEVIKTNCLSARIANKSSMFIERLLFIMSKQGIYVKDALWFQAKTVSE